MIGKQISHYQIIEELRRGGMGVVYLAEDLDLKRKVALKFLPVERTKDEEARTRFVQEAQAASALDHPNIGTIYEIGRTDEGQAFIAMAYYEGRTLDRILEDMPESTGLPLEQVLDIATQIARGLERAHEAGIIHRDIKPSNIIITERGEVKIIDFGLAKLSNSTQITRTGSTLGTVAYMSPEQVQSQPVDQRTDIWSLGVVLYEMLSGKRPFEGDYDAAICFNIVSEEPAPLSVHGVTVPGNLQQVIDKLLAKKPEERLRSLEDGFGISEDNNIASVVWKTGIRSGKLRGIAVVVMIVFAALAMMFYTNRDGGAPIVADRILVFPFEVTGNFQNWDLKQGVADLLSLRLDGVGGLRRVDQATISAELPAADRLLPTQDLSQIAKRTSAAFFVIGSILSVGDGIKLTAALYRQDGELVDTCETGMAGEASYDKLVDELTLAVIRQLCVAKGPPGLPIQSIPSSSRPALAAFLEGESKLRDGMYSQAVDA